MSRASSQKYIFTNHAYYKMRYYRLSESLVKRVIRYPTRTEEGILEGAIACMRPMQSKKYSEIWTMYVIIPSKQINSVRDNGHLHTRPVFGGIKIITAWRYPGKSSERNPVPIEVIEEARRILGI